MKKIICTLLCVVFAFSVMPAAFAVDGVQEDEIYCTIGCENNTISTEAKVVGIYSLTYNAGDYENVAFRYTYDENLLNVDSLTSDDGSTKLFVEGRKKAQTSLLIEMLSSDGTVIASEEISVNVSARDFTVYIKAVFANIEYYLALLTGYILPFIFSMPYRYIKSIIEKI